MFQGNEIFAFILLEPILILSIWNYCRKNGSPFLKVLLLRQNIFLLIFLLLSHIFSYYHYRTFPGIYPDDVIYNTYARIFSNNITSLPFSGFNESLILRNIDSVSALPYFSNSFDELPFLSFSIGGFLYFIFGYAPLIFKFLNIIYFQVSTIIFYKLIYNNTSLSKTIVYIYAFNPVFLLYAVTFLKEILILLCTLWFFYSCKNNTKAQMIFSLILLFFLRPYLSPIYLTAYLLSSSKNGLKFIIVYLLLFCIEFAGIDWLLNNIPYGKYVNAGSFKITDNSGNAHYVQGIERLLKGILNDPLAFTKYRIYYFTLAIFTPEIWVPPLLKYGIFAKDPSSLSLDGLAKLIQAPLQLYILYKISAYWVKARIFLKENMIYILSFLMLVLFNSLKSGVLRYQECITFSILLIFANFNITALTQKKRHTLLISLIILMFFLNDLIVRKRTIFNDNQIYQSRITIEQLKSK